MPDFYQPEFWIICLNLGHNDRNMSLWGHICQKVAAVHDGEDTDVSLALVSPDHSEKKSIGSLAPWIYKLLLRHWVSHRLLWFSRCVVFNSLQPCGLQGARLPCPSLSPRVCSNSCPLSWWCHPTVSSSVVPFSSCLQSFSASGSFSTSRLFASGS